MTRLPSYTFRVQHDTVMTSLGSTVGACFVRALSKKKHSLVVCAYGAHDSGKTPFMEGIMSSAALVASEDSTPRIIHKDFGNSTYPGPSYIFNYPKVGDKITLPPPDLSTTADLALLDKSTGQTSVHLLEHAPFPHLQQADLVVLISWPHKPCSDTRLSNEAYFAEMASNLERGADKLGYKKPHRHALDAVASFADALKNDLSSTAPFASEDRILRLSCPSADPSVRDAFRTTGLALRKKFAANILGQCPCPTSPSQQRGYSPRRVTSYNTVQQRLLGKPWL